MLQKKMTLKYKHRQGENSKRINKSLKNKTSKDRN